MRTFLRIVFIVVVAAVIIGTGIAIFNAGMAQGAAMSGQLSDGAPAPAASVLRADLSTVGLLGLWLLRVLRLVPALPVDLRSGAPGLWPAPRLASRPVGHGRPARL